MDAASILLSLLAAGVNVGSQPVNEPRSTPASVSHTVHFAGQSGWTSDRYETQQPAAAPDNRYPTASTSAASNVAPPPGVIDRARTAATETGNALREGIDAGIQAANQFGAAIAPPAATSKTRAGVAPPPSWADSSAMSAPDWSTETYEGAVVEQTSSAMTPRRTASGWTSIGTDVPAPPMLLPQLTASPPSATQQTTAGNNGPALPVILSGREPIRSLPAELALPPLPQATGADSWATGWGTGPGTQPATIGRNGTSSTAEVSRNRESAAVQPINPASNSQQPGSSASQPPATGWPDPWADNEPWPQSAQNSPNAGRPGVSGAAPLATNTGSQPQMGAPAIGLSPSVTTSNVILPAGAMQTMRDPAKQLAADDQPPWLPLLIVSLSLAGSLGANLFLGFSYIEARQKYRSLVHKTADKFRRAAA